MHQVLLNQLKSTVHKLELRAGDRLPAERKLACDFEVSRNSVRRLLHSLEGQGLVDIKKGSGTYVREKFFGQTNHLMGDREKNPEKLMADQLETAFLFFPIMAELAILRMDMSQIEQLQKSNVALGKSIFSKASHKVWIESLAFFRRIAMGTDNSFMVNVMEEICSVDMASFKHFFDISQEQQEQIFADHVNILNAIRERDKEKAKQVIQGFVVHLIQILETENGILLDIRLEQYRQVIS